MDEFLLQIENTLQAGSYYASLFMCLCIPDICAALESVTGEANGALYKAWFNANVKTRPERAGIAQVTYAPKFDGHEAYLLRCAALHQGQLANLGTGGRAGSRYTRIIFVEPHRGVVHLGTSEYPGDLALILDLKEFCTDMILSARNWLSQVQGIEPFETNYARMFKRHPHGIIPHIAGSPVIS